MPKVKVSKALKFNCAMEMARVLHCTRCGSPKCHFYQKKGDWVCQYTNQKIPT